MSLSLEFYIGSGDESPVTTPKSSLIAQTTGSPQPLITAVSETAITVTVDGTPHTVSGPLWTDSLSNNPLIFCMWPLSFHVATGATVTVTMASGIVTAGANSNASLTTVAVDNRSGVDWIPDPLTGDRSMRLGAQPITGSYFQPTNCVANLLKCFSQQQWRDGVSDTSGQSYGGYDSIGLPLSPAEAIWQAVVLDFPQDTQNVLGQFNLLREGIFHLLWTGTATWSAYSYAGSTVVEQGGSAQNHRIWSVTRASADAAFEFALYVDKTGGKTCTNVKLYGPNISNPLSPPEFDPDYVAQYSTNNMVRLKDWCQIDGGQSCADPDDFPTDAQVNWSLTPQKYRVPVTSVTSSNSGIYRRDGINRPVITAPGHGLKIGQRFFVYFPNPGGVAGIQHPLNKVGGGTFTQNFDGTAYPLDADHFVFGGFMDPSQPALLVNDLTSTGAFLTVATSHPAMDTTFRLPGAINSDCQAVYSMPPCITDAGAYALGQAAAQNYTPGIPLYIEYGNECWNPSLAYIGHFICETLGAEMALADGTWPSDAYAQGAWMYALRSGQVQTQFEAGWNAAGGQAGMVKFAVNVPPNGAAYLDHVLRYRSLRDTSNRVSGDPGFAGPVRTDIIMTSTYLSIYGANTNFGNARWDALTVGQARDYGDAFMVSYAYNLYTLNYFAQFKSVLAGSVAPSTPYAAYEGGPRSYACGSVAEANVKTVSLWYGPAARKWYLLHLRYHNDQGFVFSIKLGGAGLIQFERVAGIDYTVAYYPLVNYNSEAGYGDGSDAKADVRPELVNTDGTARRPDPRRLTASPQWQAVVDWTQGATVTPHFTVSPTTVVAGTGSLTLTLVGTSTTWNGTVFSVSGVAGTTKTSQVVHSATSATLVINIGSTSGTLTISDGTLSAHLTITPVVSPSFVISPTTVVADSSNHTLTLTGSSTGWGGGTTFSVSGMGSVSIASQTVNSATSATVVVTVGSVTGTVTLSDGAVSHTFAVTVAPVSSGRVLLVRRG